MRWLLLIIVAGIALVVFEPWHAITRYLNPLPAATYTETTNRLTSLVSTQRYAAPVNVYPVHQFEFRGHTRTYHLYVPDRVMTPTQAVILLHGSTRNGASMLDMWDQAADTHGMILVAPDAHDPSGWHPTEDGADFILNLMKEAALQAGKPIDDWFVFGHSAGAVHVPKLMVSDQLTLSAVAVHGGGPRAETVVSGSVAIPYRAYIGEADELFPLPYIRDGGRALAAAGYPTEIVVLSDHGHWFYNAGPRIADDAARWFQAASATP